VRGEEISLLLRCFQPPDLVTAGNKDVAYSPGMPVIGGQRWEFLIRLPGRFRYPLAAKRREGIASGIGEFPRAQ
jgi:hypothetical protein